MEDKKPYITVYQPMCGWNSVHVWWNPDMGGFWEPYQTGFGPYQTREMAVEDGRAWAEAEGLEFRE